MTDRYEYNAYGELIGGSGTTSNKYLYAGEQHDPETGLYYNRARYYNPQLGRFTQMDSWGGSDLSSITLNKYLYGNASPTNFVDPSGHSSFNLNEISVTQALQNVLSASIVQHFRVILKEVSKDVVCFAVEEIAEEAVISAVESGVYILADEFIPGAKYVGETKANFDSRLKEHFKDARKKIKKTLARFHFATDDKGLLRILEQRIMDLLEEAGEELTNRRKSIALSPASNTSKTLRNKLDNIIKLCK